MHIILEVVHEHWGSKLAQSCAFPTRGDLKCSPVEGAVSKALRLSHEGKQDKRAFRLDYMQGSFQHVLNGTMHQAQHCFASEI